MGKAGRPPGPTGPRCVALFRRGLTAAAIARELGLAYRTVHYHLMRAGIDSGERWVEARAKFVALWNAAADLGAAAKAAGLTEPVAAVRATRLRRMGYVLKRMPSRRDQNAQGGAARAEGCADGNDRPAAQAEQAVRLRDEEAA